MWRCRCGASFLDPIGLAHHMGEQHGGPRVLRKQDVRKTGAQELSTSAQLRSAELETAGVREELTRQANTNEDLRGTLAMRERALRETQQALAASQADLSRVERERDEVSANFDRLAIDYGQLLKTAHLARQELERLRAARPTQDH